MSETKKPLRQKKCKHCSNLVTPKWLDKWGRFHYPRLCVECLPKWNAVDTTKYREVGETRITTKKGFTYRHIKIAHKRRSGSYWVLEHRLIAEQTLGRALRDDEIVHHINQDTLDNRPENLQVMSRSEHIREHKRIIREVLWSRKFRRCIRCGTNETPYGAHGLCQKCYMRDYSKEYYQKMKASRTTPL